MAVVHRRKLLLGLFLAHFFKPLGSAEAIIRAPFFDQLLRVLFIKIVALRLNVRSAVTLFMWTFVIINAAPLHRGDDIFQRAFNEPSLIGILNAKHERATVVLCE